MALVNKDNHKLTNLELSIQISLSGLSFCTLDRKRNEILVLRDIYFDKKLNPLEVLDRLKACFKTENSLQQTFSKVCVIHDNDLATLVPQSLFNEDCLADYLKFNSKILKSDYITFDSIDINKSVNVYVPYININNFIYDRFGSFTYKHASTILIENLLQIDKNVDKTKLYVNVSKTHYEVVAVHQTNLLLYNTFEYGTKEDFIYYLLFSAEQLKLNPETLNLVFIGDIVKSDALYNMAYKYIRNISFGNRHDAYRAIQHTENHHSNFTLIKSF